MQHPDADHAYHTPYNVSNRWYFHRIHTIWVYHINIFWQPLFELANCRLYYVLLLTKNYILTNKIEQPSYFPSLNGFSAGIIK